MDVLEALAQLVLGPPKRRVVGRRPHGEDPTTTEHAAGLPDQGQAGGSVERREPLQEGHRVDAAVA